VINPLRIILEYWDYNPRALFTWLLLRGREGFVTDLVRITHQVVGPAEVSFVVLRLMHGVYSFLSFSFNITEYSNCQSFFVL
jgi:hypothetical protein